MAGVSSPQCHGGRASEEVAWVILSDSGETLGREEAPVSMPKNLITCALTACDLHACTSDSPEHSYLQIPPSVPVQKGKPVAR